MANKEFVIMVFNLSTNKVGFKKMIVCNYREYIDWIWISCNYLPFTILASKYGCEYGDCGLGTNISIEEALRYGIKEIDTILLNTEFSHTNRMPS